MAASVPEIALRAPPAPTLADLARGRNNNFNLIRVTLAAMVLVHHAFVLTGNAISPDNILLRGVANLGEIGVGGFFIVSGFLVTRSLRERSSVLKFVAARVLRIFPGLWVMLALTTTLLAAFSVLAPADYFAHPQTWLYALRNGTAFLTAFELPGVFRDNVLPAANGSLWSLRYEMLCYTALAVAGLLGLAARGWPIALVAAALGATLVVLPDELPYALDLIPKTAYLFAVGAVAATYSGLVRLRLVYTALLVGVALLLDRTPVSLPAWGIAFGYLLLWIAYVPKGAILSFNHLPDISYGFYIYAFPFQQIAVALGVGATPLTNFAWAGPATILCATLSWYLVEKPALALKNRIGRRKDPRAEPDPPSAMKEKP